MYGSLEQTMEAQQQPARHCFQLRCETEDVQKGIVSFFKKREVSLEEQTAVTSCANTEAHLEGSRAFVKKRAPVFNRKRNSYVRSNELR